MRMELGWQPFDLVSSLRRSCANTAIELTYLSDLCVMRTPCVAKVPQTVFVLVIDLYLPVDRASCETVAVKVVCARGHHVPMCILEELESFIFWLAGIFILYS